MQLVDPTDVKGLELKDTLAESMKLISSALYVLEKRA